MEIWSALLSFGVVAALLTIIPGLDTTLVLRSAISRGRAYAFAAAIGIGTGALTWGVAAALGASALLAASELGYRLLTLAGAGYLIWLGAVLLIRSLRRDRDHEPVAEAEAPEIGGSPVRAWLTGFGTNLLNPKIGAFYLATLPQFIPEGTSPLLMGALLAMEHNLLGMIWFSLIILGAGLARRWLRRPAVIKLCDRICGVVLIGFGLKLALQPRPS